MATFVYTAKLPNGTLSSGEIEAATLKAANDLLRARRITPVSVIEKQSGFARFKLFKPKVTQKDIVIFSRQMSTLIAAGVPIVRGLAILSEQIENPAFAEVVKDIRVSIESGFSIEESLRRHPKVFTELYVSMIKAGEVGGILDVIMERLSAYLEAAEALRAKIKGAMVYPLVVSVVAAAITVFLLVAVIPTFKTVFDSFHAELPLPTRILLGLSDFLRHNLIFILLGVAGAIYGIKRWVKTDKGQRIFDAYVLKLPVFGLLLTKVAIAKFTRTLGTLIKSGVPILQSLDTVAKTAGNRIIEDAIMAARTSVKEGEKLADPLRRSGVFPPMVIQMISIGEETGSLETMLTKIADFYDHEVDEAVKAMTSIIEPIVIVVMGVVIGAIVIAMFFPIFQLSTVAGGL